MLVASIIGEDPRQTHSHVGTRLLHMATVSDIGGRWRVDGIVLFPLACLDVIMPTFTSSKVRIRQEGHDKVHEWVYIDRLIRMMISRV